ncbi:MAG: GNAT family N-acetyltransferase [Pseudomonadota bacterium]
MKVAEPSTPDEFKHYYELRWKILRAPWNQPRGSEQDELEKTSCHMMVIDKNTIIAVGRLQLDSTCEARIRYMAVDISQQHKGVGTLLLNALEQRAVELGAERIVLDARENALGFYRKHGYKQESPGHILFNAINHITMTKSFDSWSGYPPESCHCW